MDWKNIDLSRPSELEQFILSPYSFKMLLLEIACNLPKISEETIKQQFETELQKKVTEAREIFTDNLNNILKEAKRERAIP